MLKHSKETTRKDVLTRTTSNKTSTSSNILIQESEVHRRGKEEVIASTIAF